jgi:hypothetical protein
LNPHQPQQTLISYAIAIVIIGIVFALRMRRIGKMRRLRLETLWIAPALYLAISVLMFFQLPPKGSVALASAAALVLGAAVGWKRGTLMHIHVDPETHALNQKASPAAMLFLLALVAVRMLGRGVLNAEGVSPAMVTDPLIAFAIGMLTLTRVEMYFRGRRLLEEARSRA